MFAELMPLLRKRGLLLTISLVEGETIIPRDPHNRLAHNLQDPLSAEFAA